MSTIPRNKSSELARNVETHSPVLETQNGSAATTVVFVRNEADDRAVYDLTVADCPEFFANGLLVHNCLDAARMGIMGLVQHSIEEFIGSKKKQKPVLDSFMQP